MTEKINLKVRNVIGTGDPLEAFDMIVLVCQWGLSDKCFICDGRVSRIWILDPPYEGATKACVCEKCHKKYGGE